MASLKSQFLLRDDITFLNFGSFGACPKPIFEEYQRLQLQLEKEPVHFITQEGMTLLAQARKALGDFIHCHMDDLVYMTNPSYAVNTVARSLQLKPGDEVLTTNLEYGACDRTWEYYCKISGATYVKQTITLPLTSREQFIHEFFQGFSPKTKCIFISHITSSTGLRLPVEEICAEGKRRGVLTFVDGAHAPGQIPLNIQQLDADIYTGACHKWMMTPKGSSFLYVKREHQHWIDPIIISWGYHAQFPSHSQFQDYHTINGSRDYTAFLTIPTSIRFMQEHRWTEVAVECRQLVYQNAQEFADLFQTTLLAPLRAEFICQMCAVEIRCTQPEQLHDLFLEKYQIQIPVFRHGNKVYLRYSINAYNEQKDLDHLFNSIRDIKKTTALIGD